MARFRNACLASGGCLKQISYSPTQNNLECGDLSPLLVTYCRSIEEEGLSAPILQQVTKAATSRRTQNCFMASPTMFSTASIGLLTEAVRVQLRCWSLHLAAASKNSQTNLGAAREPYQTPITEFQTALLLRSDNYVLRGLLPSNTQRTLFLPVLLSAAL
jgi:hypothetical protein